MVHFAAIPQILQTSDNEFCRVHTVGTYKVIDGAVKIGGVKSDFRIFQTDQWYLLCDRELKADYLPIDEDHPTVPQDSYAMPKVVNQAKAGVFKNEAVRPG